MKQRCFKGKLAVQFPGETSLRLVGEEVFEVTEGMALFLSLVHRTGCIILPKEPGTCDHMVQVIGQQNTSSLVQVFFCLEKAILCPLEHVTQCVFALKLLAYNPSRKLSGFITHEHLQRRLEREVRSFATMSMAG